MPNLIEPLDEQELKDLARRIQQAREEEETCEAALTPARALAAKWHRVAGSRRQATRKLLDDFRTLQPTGAALVDFVARLYEAREEERKAEAREAKVREAYREARQAARRARCCMGALVDGFDEQPLIALMIRNHRQAEASAAGAAPEDRPTPRRRAHAGAQNGTAH